MMVNYPWHVVQFGWPEAASAILRLGKASYPYFYPRWVTRGVLYGRSVERLVPLSPNLMFVRFDAGDPREWHNVRDCFRDTFRRFFGGERPLDIPERAFDPLHILYGADACGLMPIPSEDLQPAIFKAKDRVRILGALAVANEDGVSIEVLGTVTWADGLGTRVVYQMLGREVSGYFPNSARALEKVEGKQSAAPQYGRRKQRQEKAGLYAGA